MTLPVYYVGTPAEAEHHARPLRSEFDVRLVEADEVVRHARPGDVCIFFNEFFSRFRLAANELRRRQCATLYALDGILEWRNMWEFPPGDACLWTARPFLSHKVACIGRSQARILESWGAADQCEIIGVPRFDGLLDRASRPHQRNEPFTILVLTAKCPGFTEEQVARASRSLVDLKAWLERHPRVGQTPIRSVWRITHGLEEAVGVDNTLKDTTGDDLAQALSRADAVVTTPSTAMLEGMLHHLPVALLDYNNCPHYVPAAWRITAETHFDEVIPELVNPPGAKVHYQHHLLHDALECQTPALPRLAELIARMSEIARRCVAEGRQVAFPRRLVRPEGDPPAAESIPLQWAQLFPANAAFAEADLRRLQAEVGDLRLIAHRKSLKQRLRRLRQKAGRAVSRVGQATARRAA